MSAPVTTAPQRRAAPQVSAFMVGAILVIVASISLLALATLRLTSPDSGAVVETYVQGAGYPLHGGLAGPSRVGTIASSSYGIGYPLHGGLAGPSRLSTVPMPGNLAAINWLATRERGGTVSSYPLRWLRRPEPSRGGSLTHC